MIVNDLHNYTLISRGKKDSLDLHYPLYVGGITKAIEINENAGTSHGFIGCINRVVIDGKPIDLMNNMVASESITNCEVCEHNYNACINGVCQESTVSKDGYRCICKIGYTGSRCQEPKQFCQQGKLIFNIRTSYIVLH